MPQRAVSSNDIDIQPVGLVRNHNRRKLQHTTQALPACPSPPIPPLVNQVPLRTNSKDIDPIRPPRHRHRVGMQSPAEILPSAVPSAPIPPLMLERRVLSRDGKQVKTVGRPSMCSQRGKIKSPHMSELLTPTEKRSSLLGPHAAGIGEEVSCPPRNSQLFHERPSHQRCHMALSSPTPKRSRRLGPQATTEGA